MRPAGLVIHDRRMALLRTNPEVVDDHATPHVLVVPLTRHGVLCKCRLVFDERPAVLRSQFLHERFMCFEIGWQLPMYWSLPVGKRLMYLLTVNLLLRPLFLGKVLEHIAVVVLLGAVLKRFECRRTPG